MNETYIDVENAWAERDLPRVFESGVIVSAWMTDAEIAGQAAQLSPVYGNEFEVDTAMRLFRAQLREAAMTTAADEMTEAETVAHNMAHLIRHDTCDAELRTLADAAEAGAGGPVPDLLAELVRLRDSRRDDRLFVSETGNAPRIGNVHEEAQPQGMDPNSVYDDENMADDGDSWEDEERDR